MNLYSVLIVAMIIFVIGIAAVLTKRNAVSVLIALELSFNALVLAALGVARFGSVDGGLGGYMLALVIIVVTAVESALAIALIVSYYRLRKSTDISSMTDYEEQD